MAYPRARPLVVLLAVAVASVTACGGGGGTSATTTYPSSFRAVTSIPTDGAQGVAVDSPVQVTFNKAIDPASVTADSLRVGVVGSGEIPGSTTLVEDGAGRTLAWLGETHLAPIATHAVRIQGGLRATDGDLLMGGTELTFRTGAGMPPVPLPGADQLRSAGGTLNIGRRSHTATLLADGRVLIAGGFVQSTAITDRAEMFYPGSETFNLLTPSMHQERAGHTATRLADGRVLLAGGWYETSPGQLASTARAETFDPVTGLFTEVGDMNVERVDHAAVRLADGRVLLTGGSRYQAGFLEDLDTAEIFDPNTNTFTLLPAHMAHTHATHVMADLGTGKIGIVGGSDIDLRPEYFDVSSGQFVALLPAADDAVRFGAMGASFASGSLSVAGGDTRGTVLYLDTSTTTLRNSGSGLAKARAYGTATRIANDRILVGGGVDAGGYANGSYIILHSLDLVIEGGVGGSRSYATELLFPTPLAFHTATQLGDGRVLFCGGLNENGGQPELSVAFIFEP